MISKLHMAAARLAPSESPRGESARSQARMRLVGKVAIRGGYSFANQQPSNRRALALDPESGAAM
jgi:hypothetical protein